MFEEFRQFLRDNPRLPLIIGVAGLTGLLVVWGIWGGFSLDFSRFYAAEPTECETPSPGTHTASALTVQCGTTQNVLSWNLPPGNDANTILKNVDGADGFIVNPGSACRATTFTDTDIQPGSIYTYRHKAFADRTSNAVTCPPPTPIPTPTTVPTLLPTASPTATPLATTTPLGAPVPTGVVTPTPTTTPTTTTTATSTPPPPTPTPEPSETPAAEPGAGLFCSPTTQTIFLGQIAFLQAFGGDGTRYTWEGDAGAIQEDDDGSPGAVAFGWTTRGTKVVTVRSADEEATCIVEVQDPNATPGPQQPTGPVTISKQARNDTLGQTAPRESVTVSTDQRIRFIIRVTDREGDGTEQVFVRDTLPPGMSYVRGSTTVDGVAAADGIATGRLPIGEVPAGGVRTVQWSAVADRLGELPVGAQTVQPEAIVETTENGEPFVRADGVTLTLLGTGTGAGGPLGGAGVPATGPGGATLLAFVVAAVSSLLYAAYTRSPGFRRRELRHLGDDQGPMDFRN